MKTFGKRTCLSLFLLCSCLPSHAMSGRFSEVVEFFNALPTPWRYLVPFFYFSALLFALILMKTFESHEKTKWKAVVIKILISISMIILVMLI